MQAERNPNYFGTAYFDSIEFLSIVDVAARTNAFLAGEVDYINRADLKTIDMLKSAPNTELYNVSGFAHYTAPMMVDRKPFDSVDVRQALKYAINRQELVDKILFGYGSPGNDNPLSASMKYATNPAPVYTYEPDVVPIAIIWFTDHVDVDACLLGLFSHEKSCIDTTSKSCI